MDDLNNHENREITGNVGYGRPPMHSRFKPGQSGNPKGRPVGTYGPSKHVQQLFAEAHTAEAIAHSIIERALKGNIAIKFLFDMIDGPVPRRRR